jgi:hypothetical protein
MKQPSAVSGRPPSSKDFAPSEIVCKKEEFFPGGGRVPFLLPLIAIFHADFLCFSIMKTPAFNRLLADFLPQFPFWQRVVGNRISSKENRQKIILRITKRVVVKFVFFYKWAP